MSTNKEAQKKLSFLDTADRFAIQTHLKEREAQKQDVTPRLQFNVDVEDEKAMEQLLKGPLPFKLVSNSQTVATGKIVGFAPLIGQEENGRASNAPLYNGNEKSKALERLKKLKSVNLETPEIVEYPTKEKINEITSEVDKEKSPGDKNAKESITFVVADYKDKEFVFRRYTGSIPPRFCGTFITITRLETGQLIRTIRNYDEVSSVNKINIILL